MLEARRRRSLPITAFRCEPLQCRFNGRLRQRSTDCSALEWQSKQRTGAPASLGHKVSRLAANIRAEIQSVRRSGFDTQRTSAHKHGR